MYTHTAARIASHLGIECTAAPGYSIYMYMVQYIHTKFSSLYSSTAVPELYSCTIQLREVVYECVHTRAGTHSTHLSRVRRDP